MKWKPALPTGSASRFDTGDLTGWSVIEGDAFTDDHVTDATDWGWGGPFLQANDGSNGYHLWGFNPEHGGDGATGVLRSQTFALGGNGEIDFLVGGGNDIDTLYAALVRASDGDVLMKTSGRGDEQYARVYWDASAYLGEELYIEIVDRVTGGFGHINVDDVNVPVHVTSLSAMPFG